MKRTNKKIPVLIILLTACISCDDIFEKDITNNMITVISPQEGSVVEGNTVQFLWNTIEGAKDYRIQVHDDTLILDTLVSSPPFSYVMDSGNYQWRIRGENFAYQTAYTFPVSFKMVPTSDLTNQTLILLSPSNYLYTNNTTIVFLWEALNNAENYVFELSKATGSGTVTVYLEENITTTTLQLDGNVITEDAHYIWSVKAVNPYSSTAFFSRNLYIDTVPPAMPVLMTPEFEEEFNAGDTIDFLWDFGTDTGNITSPITSYYEVATDTSFVNIIYNGYSEDTGISLVFNNNSVYYWRVRGEDQAGNIGTYNQTGKFIVNE